MKRVADFGAALHWLIASVGHEEITGYDAAGWPSSTWVLHAMYEHPELIGLGTHDDLRRRRLELGIVKPAVIGDVDLDAEAIVTGVGFGFVTRPAEEWKRLNWHDYIARSGAQGASCGFPPCDRWFPDGSWPVAIDPPSEGSLDEESLMALTEVLSNNSPRGAETECYAYYAPMAVGQDFDNTHLWKGPLQSILELLDENGGDYGGTPSNFWPVDKSWFVWTDWDLLGTKVSGSAELMATVRGNDVLETNDWKES